MIKSEGAASERRVSVTGVLVVAVSVVALPVLHLCNRLSVRWTLAAVAQLARISCRWLETDPKTIGRAVNYAARILRLQGTTCLARSQVIWLLLSVGGEMPVVRVGAAAGLGRGVSAHAWVELDDVPVADPVDIAEQHPPFDRPLLEPAD